MGIGYSVPKECALKQFLAISLESPDMLGVLEPKIESQQKGLASVDGQMPAAEASDCKQFGRDGGASPSVGMVHRMVRKQWRAGVERVLRRGPQLTVHLGASPLSSSPSLGGPSASELAELRDLLCRLIALLESDFRLEAAPYTGKMFVRNTMIFSTVQPEDLHEGDSVTGGRKCPFREYVLDTSECVIWVGIRSKNVLQLSQSALGPCCSHCCLPAAGDVASEEEVGFGFTEGFTRQFILRFSPQAALLRWIRAEFSGAKVAQCPQSGGNPEMAASCTAGGGHGRPRFAEVHLPGQPFASQKFDELVTARRLFLGLFRHFQTRGFSFCAQLSAKGGSKNDTVVWKRKAESAQSSQGNGHQQKQFFLLSCESKCHLRLFECPTEAAQVVEESFADLKIKQIRPSWMGCSEIVFGLPLFWTEQSLLLDTHLAMLRMLAALWLIGWKVAGIIQIGQSLQDKASIVFESTEPMGSPVKLFGLSTARVDQLRLLEAPITVRTAVRAMVEAQWERGIQEEVPSHSDRVYIFKLRGRPWSCRDNSLETASGLHLLVFIAERLHQMGWRLFCSMDPGAKVNDDDDAHLYCEEGELFVFWQPPPCVQQTMAPAAVPSDVGNGNAQQKQEKDQQEQPNGSI